MRFARLSQSGCFVIACIAAVACLALSLSGTHQGSYAAVLRANPDYDVDGDVDADDLLRLHEAQSCGDPSCDLDGDGKYTARDFFLFSTWWGASIATPTPTPTPTATLPPYVTPLPTLSIELPGGVTLAMVRIPAGNFMMGRNPGEQDSYAGEDPRHQVTIGYPFFVGRYELTKAQWQAVVGTTPWQGMSEVLNDPNSPAVHISWDDIRGAGGFLDHLNALGQGSFRLPSEAEWEYACRAGTTTRFYWGNDSNYSQIGNYAWYVGNASNAGETYAHVVGLKLPNAWGLYDMSGNVWEWCEDDGHFSYSLAGRPDNGAAWVDSPRGQYRLERGGEWSSDAAYCRSAYRTYDYPNSRYSTLGLRVVREVPPTPTPTATPSPTPTPTPTPTPSPLTVNLPNLPVGARPLVLVPVPAGSFMMGRNTGEQDSFANEDPRHQVVFAASFFIGACEITQGQWQAVMGTTPWRSMYNVLDDQDSPAVYVSWEDIRGASGFLDHLNALGQGTFRLPSEAEWEYACRAGTTTRFYWGNDPSYSQIGNYAWYQGNASSVGESYAHGVGLKLPNAWGLYDMSGNVWEWCEDDWHESYSGANRPDNGAAWIDNPRGPDRVIRGGCIDLVGQVCRSAFRHHVENHPYLRTYYLGFRVAWSP